MNNNQLAEVARILGVSEDSISAMDDEIKNSMTAVFEQIAVKNDEDKKAIREVKIPKRQEKINQGWKKIDTLKRSYLLRLSIIIAPLPYYHVT